MRKKILSFRAGIISQEKDKKSHTLSLFKCIDLNRNPMQFVKRIQLKKTKLLERLCFVSKNLFNVANYEVRQHFLKTGKWMQYNRLYKLLKDHKDYKELHKMAGSHPPQQVLRQVVCAWKSFFNALKAFKKNPSKFLGRPKLPKYKRKSGHNLVIFTNLQCRIRNGYCLLTRKLEKQGFPPIKTYLENCKGVRILPYGDRYMFEIIYEKDCVDLNLDKSRCIGIDLGLTNLVTASNNIGITPMIIKGGIVKSINQFYNKKCAQYRSTTKKVNKMEITRRILRLNRIRNNKIIDFFHKTSRTLINYCIENNIGTIIIGYNELWKQNINIGKRNNQNFVQIPFHKLIHKIIYKAELVGILVKTVSEEYTSQQCSQCGVISKSNRKYRGLYVCSTCGCVLNADVNAATNILRKEVPKSFGIGDRGVLITPVCITV